MNELIQIFLDKLVITAMVETIRMSPDEVEVITVENFKQAIQTACKAQRNACARVYEDYGEADEIGYNKSKIKSAEITEQDYE